MKSPNCDNPSTSVTDDFMFVIYTLDASFVISRVVIYNCNHVHITKQWRQCYTHKLHF